MRGACCRLILDALFVAFDHEKSGHVSASQFIAFLAISGEGSVPIRLARAGTVFGSGGWLWCMDG